jgi:maltose alpha-D-glucosyltransferase/alpha-amylase
MAKTFPRHKLRAHIDSKFSDRMLLAEANQWPEDAVAYFGQSKDGVPVGDECHMCFHFPVMPRMFMALQMEDRFPIIDILEQTPAIPETCQWGMFLRNHDELTLEMVTDEERDYMYRVYATDSRARINLGIRRRLAPLLNNSRRKIELINILLFSLPGTPILYYGDEIGMGDNIFLGDRNGVRTPMQWSPDRNAGFSSANPQQLFLPIIIDPEYHYESVNVDNQERNVSSLLWWMRRTIAMRQRHAAFGRGTIEFLFPDNAKVLAFVRKYENETILVVVNLSRYSQVVELDLAVYAGHTPTELFSRNKFPIVKDAPYLLTLGPHGHYWLQLEQLADVINMPEKRPTPAFAGHLSWKELLGDQGRRLLERSVLPGYVPNCRWFGGKARAWRSMELRDIIRVGGDGYEARVLLFDVIYVEGSPETYVLPLQIAAGEAAHKLAQEHPQAVIAQFDNDGASTILFDAIYEPQFRDELLAMMIGRDTDRGQSGSLTGETTAALRKRVAKGAPMTSLILRAEQSNTSAIYGGEWFLKLYRRLDEGLNPDVEVSRFLTERAGFSSVPPFAGAIAYESENVAPRMICMMQAMVQNQGDAWTLTLGVVGQYFERVLTEKLALPEIKPGEVLPPEFIHALGTAYPERVMQLAQRTAEMHLALAGERVDPAFRPEAFSALYQRSVYQSMRNGLRRTFQLLAKQKKKLTGEALADAEAMLAREKEILDRMARVMGRRIAAEKIRIHGDYHLGQVLDTGRDFVIIDFEGEPARPISERRLKRSALRDVAGMLRSFHYAAYTALAQQTSVRDVDIPTAAPWADLWYRAIRRTFLDHYLDVVGEAAFLPKEIADIWLLLDAYLLDKAVYEVGYELNNRPDWIRVPLRGIKQILDN